MCKHFKQDSEFNAKVDNLAEAIQVFEGLPAVLSDGVELEGAEGVVEEL